MKEDSLFALARFHAKKKNDALHVELKPKDEPEKKPAKPSVFANPKQSAAVVGSTLSQTFESMIGRR